MGATKAWWLAALDPRVKLCMDVCCLTDYEELIKAHGLKEHGIYYFVPSLLKHFQTAQINELIVPRAHLSVNGRRDPLTPPAGVEKTRDYLLPLYRQHGKEQDCRIELFDCAHQELPEMRKVIVEWMEEKLAGGVEGNAPISPVCLPRLLWNRKRNRHVQTNLDIHRLDRRSLPIIGL